jgi:hypothetical protein
MYKDDGGLYGIGPLGHKIYVDEIGENRYRFRDKTNNPFKAFADAITVGLQQSDNDAEYTKLKHPIINGQFVSEHIVVECWENGKDAVIEMIERDCSIADAKRYLYGSGWKIWHEDSGYCFKRPERGTPIHVFYTVKAGVRFTQSNGWRPYLEPGALDDMKDRLTRRQR